MSAVTSHPIFAARWAAPADVAATFLRALGVSRQRRALARLNDHQLADLGLTRAEAEAELRRGFWDLPRNGH